MNFWDERYSQPELVYGTEPNDFVRSMAGRIPPGPILCLAEGQGRNAVWFATQGREVTAVDASPVGMARAREFAASRGVQITAVVADLSVWDAPEAAWAGIIATSAHFPPPVRQRVHGAIARWLKPGGVFLLEAYTPRQLEFKTGGPPDVAVLYDPEMLRADLAGLALDHLVEVRREVREGAFHTGLAAVVQCVARRA